MSEAPDRTLFESALPTSPVVGGELLLVTNRYNLLEFLSAGYVLPVPGIPKYYTDFLEVCPGRLPLVRGSISPSVVTAVSSEDPTAFPVALEIDDRLAGDAEFPSLQSDGRTASAPLGAPALAYGPAGLLPLTHVKAVHFRSIEELEEHRAREYENIRHGDVELKVSPDVFAGGGLESDALREFLEHLAPLDGATPALFDDIDRLNGARSVLAAVCPPTTRALRTLAEILAGKATGTKPPQEGPIPPWIATVLSSEQQGRPPGPEARVFTVSAEVLRREDRSAAWRPLEVLARIEERLTAEKMSKKDDTEITKNLRPISAILRNERDFKPFDRESGLSSAKALLLVLLRPDPERLCSWSRAETGADDTVMSAAAVLVGLLRGHKKLALEMRSSGLDDLLANRAATAVARLLPDALRPETQGDLGVDEETDEHGGARVRLRWGDRVVLEKTRRPPSPTERLVASDLSSPKIHGIVVEICRAMGWTDCVSTVLSVASGEFATDAKAKAIRITVPGVAEISYPIDEAAFRARLQSAELPEELRAEVVRRLSAD